MMAEPESSMSIITHAKCIPDIATFGPDVSISSDLIQLLGKLNSSLANKGRAIHWLKKLF